MMLSKAKCKNVRPINADFLMVDPTEYSQVTHMYECFFSNKFQIQTDSHAAFWILPAVDPVS